MAACRLFRLVAPTAIVVALSAAAQAQAVEQSTCRWGWLDLNQSQTGWVCNRVYYPPAPPASGSSTPPVHGPTIEETPSGVTIMRGAGSG